jgi:molybdopterin-containing oxidoreductase family membrane subunit
MSSAPGIRIKGIYEHLDCMLTGVDRLKKANIQGWTVLSPLPRHEMLDIVYEGRPSPVRWWTLTGAITGMTIGLLLTSLTATQWPMILPGGKPVVALVPYAVVMFECTILGGALFTTAGAIVHCGLPGFWLDKSLQDPRVTDASFGIVFTDADTADQARIEEILRGSGAVEVTSGDATLYDVPNN